MKSMIQKTVFFLFLFSSLLAHAVTIPNTFEADTPAKADEVNANFTALKDAIEAVEPGIQGIQGPQGVQGDTGTQGIQGVPGMDGAQGNQGIKGDQGDKGDPTYIRTVLVSPIPGDEPASGTAILDALAGITDESAANPYLIKIEPGIYDLGASALQMKEYVSIAGSGEKVTMIKGTGLPSLWGANNAELRFLTFDARGPITNNNASPTIRNITIRPTDGRYGIINDTGSNPIIKDVIIDIVEGATEMVSVGIENNSSSSPTITNVVIRLSGTSTNVQGIRNRALSSPIITNTTIIVSAPQGIGLQTSGDGGTVIIRNSTIQVQADGYSISKISGGTHPMKLSFTELIGPVQDPGSNFTCLSVHNDPLADGNYRLLDGSCQ